MLGFSDFTVGRYIEATVTCEEEILIAPVQPYSSRKPKIIPDSQPRKTTVAGPKLRRYCHLEHKIMLTYLVLLYMFHNAEKEDVKLGESVYAYVYTCCKRDDCGHF